MARINILEKNVYCKISAGEVVENPSSVVKELIENSLDAGATNITVEIVNGGIKEIRVIDNGCGIEYDDLKKAFMPHATSKITISEDLDSIATLGFRGEALASIGSVSKVELVSKTKTNDVAGKIVIAGGETEEITQVSGNTGTSITVRNLFYNTPARLKFLRKPKQEETAITNIVNRLMFAKPEIYIKYVVDGKTIYNCNTPDLKDKIYAVYGKETARHLIEVNNKRGNLELKGYISPPLFSKANKTYQTLIINGRYVVNKLISTANLNAFENFMMKGRFPLFVLTLNLPTTDVDVNVHPNKLDVKFKDSDVIYNFVYTTILETLNNTSSPKNFLYDDVSESYDEPMPKEIIGYNREEIFGKDSKETSILSKTFQPAYAQGYSYSSAREDRFKSDIVTASVPVNNNQDDNDEDETITDAKDYKPPEVRPYTKEEAEEEFNNFDFFSKENININPFDNFHVGRRRYIHEQQKIFNDIEFRIIGNLFNTYLLIEFRDSFYIIDQHAGHERVLYDEFMMDFEAKKLISQPLLEPFIFDVNELEKGLIEENITTFRELGFDIEEFGRTSYRIVAVPEVLVNINLLAFLQDSLKNIYKVSKTNEQIKHYFATCACKAAVKAGQPLHNEEVKFLLARLMETDRKLLCPHGRPVCVRLTKTEIEKMFKRIV